MISGRLRLWLPLCATALLLGACGSSQEAPSTEDYEGYEVPSDVDVKMPDIDLPDAAQKPVDTTQAADSDSVAAPAPPDTTG